MDIRVCSIKRHPLFERWQNQVSFIEQCPVHCADDILSEEKLTIKMPFVNVPWRELLAGDHE